MAYVIAKPFARTGTDPVVLWTNQENHSCTLDVEMYAPISNTTATLLIRTPGQLVDIPVVFKTGIDLTNTKVIRAIHLFSGESLVISGLNIEGFVNGAGYRAPDLYTVPQGKFFNARGVRVAGTNRVVVTFPNMLDTTFTVAEAVAFMTVDTTAPTVQVRIFEADVPVTGSSVLRPGSMATIRIGSLSPNNKLPTVICRSKYLVFEVSDPGFNVHVQYLLRRDI